MDSLSYRLFLIPKAPNRAFTARLPFRFLPRAAHASRSFAPNSRRNSSTSSLSGLVTKPFSKLLRPTIDTYRQRKIGKFVYFLRESMGAPEPFGHILNCEQRETNGIRNFLAYCSFLGQR